VALRWIQLAAQQDYLPAVDALAQAYSTGGSFGLEVNPRLAAQYQAQADRLRGIEPGRGKKKGRKPAGASEEKR
jgi:TPR repeat protein